MAQTPLEQMEAELANLDFVIDGSECQIRDLEDGKLVARAIDEFGIEFNSQPYGNYEELLSDLTVAGFSRVEKV